jgi:sec-independent protein translocase protein TatB
VFDISFGQLLLVLIIGLVVLGPERLPIAIKTVAGWIKVLRRMSATVQLELNKELKLQELQDSLKKAELSGLKTLTPEIQESIDDLKRVTESLQKEIDSATQIDTHTHLDKDK